MAHNAAVAQRTYELVADIRTAAPATLQPALRQFLIGEITPTAGGFHVVATLSGENARDLNRALLSALRRVERRTSLRATWTAAGATERFFDYVPKGSSGATVRDGPRARSGDRPAPEGRT